MDTLPTDTQHTLQNVQRDPQNVQHDPQGRQHTPQISLLIPVYNVEAYLAECLDSALTQTFTDIEIICIDDGSTDSSPEILTHYAAKDPRIRIITKANSGYGDSMNQGLAAARGTYIAILESDDIFEPDALEHLYDLATDNNTPVAKADFWLYWSTPHEGKPAPYQEQFHIIPDGYPLNTPANPIAHPEIFYQKPSIWSGLYKRDFLEQNDIAFLPTPGAAYQDASFTFKVWASAPAIAVSTKPILKYRQDNEQSSVNSPGKVYCACDEYAEMERWLSERPELREKLEGIKERMKFDTYMWNYDRLSEELRAEFLTRAADEFRTDLAAGNVDLSLFEPWAEADLRALLDSPDDFQAVRAKYAKTGKLNTFKHYYRLGGFPLIAKLAVWKFKH